MKRVYMDRFIDSIEWVAAGFVGIVAANIFISVVLRNLFTYSIPDSYDFGRPPPIVAPTSPSIWFGAMSGQNISA
jgi:hypothetical protein